MKDKIIDLLKDNKFITIDQIKEQLNIIDDDTSFLKDLEELEKDYIIYKSKKNHYSLLEDFGYYIGTVELKKKGFGFFKSDKLEEDVFIKELDLGNALDNDTVLVSVMDEYASENRRKEGRVIKVIKHNDNLVCRMLSERKAKSDLYPNINVIVIDNDIAILDDIVLLEIIEVDLVNNNFIKGKLVKIIGNANDIGIDIKSIAYKYGLNDEFSDELMDEVSELSLEFDKEKEDIYKSRRHIENQVITIDGEDAKDLDDAISVKKLDNGNYFLGVYIADVSYFVREGSLINEEALDRGTSVYLLNKVIPMLPHKLCNDLCSLNENQDKLVMACEMEIDKHGDIVSSDIFEAVINSNHRMTYTNVNKLIKYIKTKEIDDESLLEKYSDILDMVQDMKDLSGILSSMRNRRGALNFDIPEAKFIFDDGGNLIDIALRERFEAEKLIEDFMICANECVATTISNLDLPFIYRVHDKPNSLKLEKLQRLLKNSKYSLKLKSKTLSPAILQDLLNQVGSEDAAISTMLLRMMAKAKYSEINIGHYGLASDCYTHFTSPIRRYPDLLVHRLLKKYLIHNEDFYSNYDNNKEVMLQNEIANIANLSSEAEVNATLCEYEVEDMKKAEYMEEHIGEEFDGKISSITNFGMFVTLANTIEGLVHVRSMDDDYYEYDEGHMQYVGRSKHKIYKLGDKVRVVCVGASKESVEVDFKLINNSHKSNSMVKYTKRKNTNEKQRRNKGRSKK